ncbi:MAG: DUF1848 domain-containing protein [Thermodesulfobacteriota bacterium]
MHVISASRRTDVPAFHARWFMNRIRAGAVSVLSPFGGGLKEVSLAPEDVIAIVFWTKHAGPLLGYLEELQEKGHCFTFLYTVNNYPPQVEPGVPGLTETVRVLETLARRFPTSVIRWRYDTIVLTESLDHCWHLDNFRSLCRLISPYASECIFSFCDYYKKTVRNMTERVPDYQVPDYDLRSTMAEELASIASEWRVSVTSCSHDDLVSGAVGKACCIDPEVLAKVVDSPERVSAVAGLKKTPSRKECGCYASRDIGAYDTCSHGCVYCYANTDPEQARRNMARITPHRSCLDPRVTDSPGGTGDTENAALKRVLTL